MAKNAGHLFATKHKGGKLPAARNGADIQLRPARYQHILADIP